ncbi:uncharacterized protein LOC135151487 [Daucus carota subsp. sativus]|uniref:uncharacterized protein LOC135151487 n=1 Tax=Daucus carota subsp. sativus TaxID=79200 RepID=UPI003083675A
MKPPEFRGTQDPVEAQSWLKEMEKAFILAVVTDEKKVEYASYFLKGEANYLWESARALEEVVQKAMVIEGESDQNQKEKDSKKRKFVSKGEGSAQGSQSGKNFKKFGFQNQGGPRGFKKSDNRNPKKIQGPSNQNSQQETSECKFCNKKHAGNCNKADIVCFKCNLDGHYSNKCQSPKPSVTCFKCGKTGHMSRSCKAFGTSKLMQLAATPYNQGMTSSVPILQLPSTQVLSLQLLFSIPLFRLKQGHST